MLGPALLTEPAGASNRSWADIIRTPFPYSPSLTIFPSTVAQAQRLSTSLRARKQYLGFSTAPSADRQLWNPAPDVFLEAYISSAASKVCIWVTCLCGVSTHLLCFIVPEYLLYSRLCPRGSFLAYLSGPFHSHAELELPLD